MSPLLKKEIRLLLPAWCVAMLMAAVPPWFFDHPHNAPSSFWFGALGAIILAVSAFGREFALGTFSSLLAQPVPRWRIMFTKSSALLVALIAVLVAYWISYLARVEVIVADEPQWWVWLSEFEWAHQQESLRRLLLQLVSTGLLGVVVIFAGGLWTTLVFRQMVSSFWITVLVPAILLGSTVWIATKLHMEMIVGLGCSVMLLYSFVALVGSWRLFHRMEDTPFTWGNQALPSLGELLGIKRDRRMHNPSSPVMALVRQEISLHQASLIAAGVLLLLNLVAIAVQAWGDLANNSSLASLLEMRGFIWLLIPLFLGASAIAEERRHGTLESYLCLPIPRWRQFLLKFGVAAVLGILLGVGALVVTEVIGKQLGAEGFSSAKVIGGKTILWLTAGSVGLTFAGFYASSLSRSTLQALGVAILTLFGPVINRISSLYTPLPPWIIVLHWGALVLLAAFLSYRNFGYIHCGFRRIRQNVMAIVLTLAVVGSLSAGTYFRVWELVMPREPDHGPARIGAGGPAQIAATWADSKLLILLPDGRLWVSGKASWNYDGLPLPKHGHFLSASNWTSIASCGIQTIGLRSDGTLWSLNRSEWTNNRWKQVEDEAHQVGEETNWVTIAAGGLHLLALKNDGTLWGWGNNKYAQVCEGPEILTNGPVRIGLDTDWAAVFARYYSTVGVKQDGTAWQWGHVYSEDKEGLGFKTETYTRPVRWGVDLRGVKDLLSGDGQVLDLLLREDGSLGAVGYLFLGILGTPTLPPHYSAEPVEVGLGHLWSDIAISWSQVAGVSLDGHLWKSSWRNGDVHLQAVSKYSDWIAVEGVFGECLVALAADGTVSCWSSSDRSGTLAPSRLPLTSFNIFDEPE